MNATQVIIAAAAPIVCLQPDTVFQVKKVLGTQAKFSFDYKTKEQAGQEQYERGHDNHEEAELRVARVVVSLLLLNRV